MKAIIWVCLCLAWAFVCSACTMRVSITPVDETEYHEQQSQKPIWCHFFICDEGARK